MRSSIPWGEFVFNFFVIATIAMYINTLSHEWAHSFMASIFKIKSNPFDIHYTPFLFGIDEKIDYSRVSELKSWKGALISLAGPLSNFIFACFSIILILSLHWRSNMFNRSLLFFFYSLAFFGIGGWSNYTIIRGIKPRGDIANFLQYASIPAWTVYITGIITTAILLFLFFGPVRVKFCEAFNLITSTNKALQLIIVIFFFLMYQGSVIYNFLFKY